MTTDHDAQATNIGDIIGQACADEHARTTVNPSLLRDPGVADAVFASEQPSGPVICPLCNHDINDPAITTCIPNAASLFGAEIGFERDPASDEHCRDCGVPIGGHHHAYCTVAQCLACDDQWIGCEHWTEQADALDAQR